MLHRHPFLSVVTLAYLAFVGWVTLTPAADAPTQSDLVLRVLSRLPGIPTGSPGSTYDRAEYLANVAMSIPSGCSSSCCSARGSGGWPWLRHY